MLGDGATREAARESVMPSVEAQWGCHCPASQENWMRWRTDHFPRQRYPTLLADGGKVAEIKRDVLNSNDTEKGRPHHLRLIDSSVCHKHVYVKCVTILPVNKTHRYTVPQLTAATTTTQNSK